MTVRLHTSATDLEAHVDKMQDQAAGLIAYEIFIPEDAPALLEAAQSSHLGKKRLELIAGSIRAIAESPADQNVLCGTCDNPLKGSAYALVVFRPDVDGPAPGMCVGICRACGPTVEAIKSRACQAVQSIWPGARAITIHPDRGHS